MVALAWRFAGGLPFRGYRPSFYDAERRFGLRDQATALYWSNVMTIDKSLKVKKGVSRSRNVLTRVERIEKLQSQDRWTDETSPFSLPKIRVYKVVLKKKKKSKTEDAAEGK